MSDRSYDVYYEVARSGYRDQPRHEQPRRRRRSPSPSPSPRSSDHALTPYYQSSHGRDRRQGRVDDFHPSDRSTVSQASRRPCRPSSPRQHPRRREAPTPSPPPTKSSDNPNRSSSSLGVSILGAIAGGLAAHGVSEVATKKGLTRTKKETQQARLISTVVGATLGGLGANVYDRKLESAREREREERRKIVDKWRRGDFRYSLQGGAADEYYDVYNGYDRVYEKEIKSHQDVCAC